MPGIEVIQARLRKASSLPELLTVSFDAFEAIRILARSSEDTVPGLFAALMTTADAAVDGREAITIAPSLSRAPGNSPSASLSAADPDVGTITDAMAALGALLNERLANAAERAPIPGDRVACAEAAGAAHRIHQLTARDDDDRRLR